MTADRWLLSIPLGGLNDTLCQIDKALRFAEWSGRRLVMGTRFSGVMAEFDKVFSLSTTSTEVWGELTAAVLDDLDQLPTVPDGLSGCLRETFDTDADLPLLPEPLSRPIRLPSEDDPSVPLLIHHQQGGGNRSQRLLRRLQLEPALAKEVSISVPELPRDYLAAHVRHTDYSTDLEWFLAKLKKKVERRPIAILSDNAEVLEKAALVFPASQLLNVPRRLQADASKPQHLRFSHRDDASRWEALVDSLVSLAVLSGARRMFYSVVQQPGKFGEPIVSGFSRLAAFLFENQDVRSQLFRSEVDSPRAVVRRRRAELLAPARTKLLMRQAEKFQ